MGSDIISHCEKGTLYERVSNAKLLSKKGLFEFSVLTPLDFFLFVCRVG